MERMPEVFPKVTLIDGGTILEGRKRQGLEGPFEEVEKTFYELATLKKTSRTKYVETKRLYDDDCSPAESVKVDSTVMRFIEEKYPEELKRLIGNDVQMTTVRERKALTCVSFNPKQPVLAQFARQKFITFYQKIATELQMKPFDSKRSPVKLLEAEFPELLFTTNPNTVTGAYVSIERLERFLENDFKSPSRSGGQAAQKASVKDSGSPATQHPQTDEEETCPICMDTLTEKKTLPQCKHSFCKDCVKKAFDIKPVCPICGVLYGELKGTQPEKGTMNVAYEEKSHLPGYDKYGTIVIEYYIPSGKQGEEHPSPGQRYEGAARTAYLPDSTEGRRVLALLQRGFEQRLIFTIGRSSTSGRNNVVTWNDIHHKTSRYGGPSGYGYPDPEYLSRVQDELKSKGIY